MKSHVAWILSPTFPFRFQVLLQRLTSRADVDFLLGVSALLRQGRGGPCLQCAGGCLRHSVPLFLLVRWGVSAFQPKEGTLETVRSMCLAHWRTD